MPNLVRDYVIVASPSNPILHLRSPRFADETWCGRGISTREPSDKQMDWEICSRCQKKEQRGR